MANIRVKKKENPFLQIDKTAINDDRLSPESLGVMVYILSKPNNWKAHKSEILKRFQPKEKQTGITTTKNKIDNVFIELRECGYITIEYSKDEKTGKMIGSEYVFHETPQETEIPKFSELGDSSEIGTSSEFGKSLTVGNVPILSNNDSLNNNLSLKSESTPTLEKNLDGLEEKPTESKKNVPPIDVTTLIDPRKPKQYSSALEMYNDFKEILLADTEFQSTLKGSCENFKIPFCQPVISDFFKKRCGSIYVNHGHGMITPKRVFDILIEKLGYSKTELLADIKNYNQNEPNRIK